MKRQKTLHDMVTQAGYVQFWRAQDEETDLYTYRKGKFILSYSQDEGSWWLCKGKKVVTEGLLCDGSIEKLLRRKENK